MKLDELKKLDIPRDSNGKALRGLRKMIALRRREEDKNWKEYDIKDHMVGNAKVVKEEALDTKKVEDIWDESGSEAAEYRSVNQYLVRQVKDSNPPKYEAFLVKGDKRTPHGKYTADELAAVLQPIRADQKPDVEGFTTYVDPEKVEAFQYTGDPVKVLLGKTGQRLNKGDYVIRSNDGNNFTYVIDSAANFEATLKKV